MLKKLHNVIKTDGPEKSGLISMAVKPLAVILSLLYIPLLLNYLGDERYGVWATILSIISWINYFDVGIGNGLRNGLTKDLTNKDYLHAKQLVSTSYIILTFISGGIFLLLLLSVNSLNWKNIFSTEIVVEPTLIITFAFICINFILSLVNTILYALQMAEKVAIRNCFVQLINIVSLIVLSRITEGSLVIVAIIFGASTLFVNVFSTFHIIKGRDYLRPSLRSYNKRTIPDICKTGLQFFIIQIMCLLMFTMDNLIISHYFGPNAVTSFSIANKIYNTGYSFIAAFLVPYWSGTTSAIERGGTEWIRSSIKKIMKILFVFIVGSLIVTVLFRQITFMWLHKELEYGTGIPELMCVFYVLYSILAIECQFINGTGMLRVQLIMYMILGIGNVPLSILMGVNMGMHAFGVRLATTILVLIAVIVLGINLKMIIKKIEKRK